MTDFTNDSPNNGVQLGREKSSRRFHQIRTVRLNQGVSLRTLSRRSGISLGKLKTMEDERKDIPLSELYEWCVLLDVPLSELLLEPSGSLSSPIRERACLVRIMKTAKSLLERCRDMASQALAQTLLVQLAEIMPELKEVNAWNDVGIRRSVDDLGRAADFGAALSHTDWRTPIDDGW